MAPWYRDDTLHRQRAEANLRTCLTTGVEFFPFVPSPPPPPPRRRGLRSSRNPRHREARKRRSAGRPRFPQRWLQAEMKAGRVFPHTGIETRRTVFPDDSEKHDCAHLPGTTQSKQFKSSFEANANQSSTEFRLSLDRKAVRNRVLVSSVSSCKNEHVSEWRDRSIW